MIFFTAIKNKIYPLTLTLLCLGLLLPSAWAEPLVSARITNFDPEPGAPLSFYEKLYLEVSYESDVSLRFQPIPLRNGVQLEYGAMESTASLQAAGKGKALVWVSFSNPTHIDEVSIRILDAQWQEIDRLGLNVDTLWGDQMREQPRQPAAWVETLTKKERLRQELVFDPTPQQEETAYDIFFYLSAFTIPFYLFLQIQFIRLWRGRWRELAAIPLISIVPMIVISLFGLGMDFRLWVIFIFRGMPLTLLYLLVLWIAKRYSNKVSSS